MIDFSQKLLTAAACGLVAVTSIQSARADSNAENALINASPQFFIIYNFVGDQNYISSLRKEADQLSPDDESPRAKRIRLTFAAANHAKPNLLSIREKREVLESYSALVLPDIYKTQPFTFIEALALHNYATDAYKTINPDLRSTHPSPGALAYKAVVNSALDRLPPFTGIVKRGLDLTAKDEEKFFVGNEIQFDAFTSTTSNLNLELFERTTRLLIHSITGRDLSKLSNFPGEKEVLFKAGTRFRIVKKTPNVMRARNNVRVEYELEELE